MISFFYASLSMPVQQPPRYESQANMHRTIETSRVSLPQTLLPADARLVYALARIWESRAFIGTAHALMRSPQSLLMFLASTVTGHISKTGCARVCRPVE